MSESNMQKMQSASGYTPTTEEEGQLALLKYMGVPLYPATGDESRNPEQPVNPYRQGEKQ